MGAPFDEFDEPLVQLGKRHWNRLFTLIRDGGFDVAKFKRFRADGEAPHIIAYLPDDNSDPLSFMLNAPGQNERRWNVWFDVRDFIHSETSVHSDKITTVGELYGCFINWLDSIERYETLKKEEDETPDLWELMLQEPSPNAVTIWHRDDVFKAEEVAEVRKRATDALDEIDERKLLSEEMRQVFREELEAHLPKVGQKWADWRQGLIGWGMGLVLDGIIHADVFRVVANHLMGFLAAKFGISVPPQLPP